MKVICIMKVSTAEFIKNYGTLADKALTEPLTITKNGRDRFVLVEAGEFERLKRRDRKVVATGEMSEEMLALLMKSEMPPGYEHLDEELKDWQP
jgi:PHD/YefM family antitoxin component YafN of YafNO toxin-antitoxin module